MKNPVFVLIILLLLVGVQPVQAQKKSPKNTLAATILRETDNTPMKDVAIRIADHEGQILTTLKTDSTGKIEYKTNEKYLELDIRSNDLGFKSTFRQVSLIPNNSTIEVYFLTPRDPEEVDQLKLGLQKLPKTKIPSLATTFCPDFVSGAEDTATFKEVYSCLINNIKYPLEAQELGIEGKVRVRFIIDENGQISNLELMNSSFAILEEEALRAAACLSGMSPATCEGKKVPTYYTLPLSFRLK